MGLFQHPPTQARRTVWRKVGSACPRVAKSNRDGGEAGEGAAGEDTEGKKDAVRTMQVGRIQVGTLLLWMPQVGTMQGSTL